ncbi:hypothetical protein TNCV_3095351 [Trichonephila clavipes]|uniref:Uncharacterized protein n=1 Tax=Trichonephila clavipes TaxID=2585209 RepID=A0A8X6WGC2_TRICX|nr:hypothetical protein TNCV_3095351 [Trichonephila clavipes]
MATQKFLDYPDHLARAAVYRDSSVKPIKESYESWNKVGQQMFNTPNTNPANGFEIYLHPLASLHHSLSVLQHNFVPFLAESLTFPLLRIS